MLCVYTDGEYRVFAGVRSLIIFSAKQTEIYSRKYHRFCALAVKVHDTQSNPLPCTPVRKTEIYIYRVDYEARIVYYTIVVYMALLINTSIKDADYCTIH